MTATPILSGKADAPRLQPSPMNADGSAARHKEIPALNGLRFLAVLHVVLFHTLTSYLGHAPSLVVHFVRGAPISLGIFFVLSGFVLTYSYRDTIARDRLSFAIARFARIYPLYLVSLLVALPLYVQSLRRAPSGFAAVRHFARVAAWDLPLLQAWNVKVACEWNCPTWTISAEVFYYVLFPTLVAFLLWRSTRRLMVVGAGAIVASVALVLLLARYVVPSIQGASVSADALLLYFPPIHLAEFIVGMIAATWYARRPRTDSSRWIAGGAATVVLLAFVIPAHRTHVGDILAELALAPVFAALVVGLARGGGILGRWLSTRPMALLGRASFGIYVLHLPLFDYARLVFNPDVGRPTGLTGAAILLAWLVVTWGAIVMAAVAAHVWIEEPARKGLRALGARHLPRFFAARTAGAS